MKRWVLRTSERQEVPEVEAYLNALIAVGRQHGFSLAHEDANGAFYVEEPSEGNEEWLLSAHDARAPKA